MPLSRYITLSQAMAILGISLEHLNNMIQTGTIKAVEIEGQVVVSENSVLSSKKGRKVQPISSSPGTHKEELLEYTKFDTLAGNGIWLSESVRKYKLGLSMLHRWVQKGYIKILGKDKNRIVLDEQDVAYCAEIYKRARDLGHRWIFYADGTPYTPKASNKRT